MDDVMPILWPNNCDRLASPQRSKRFGLEEGLRRLSNPARSRLERPSESTDAWRPQKEHQLRGIGALNGAPHDHLFRASI